MAALYFLDGLPTSTDIVKKWNTDVMLKTRVFLCKAVHYGKSSKHVDTNVDVFTVLEKNSSMSWVEMTSYLSRHKQEIIIAYYITYI